MSFFAKCISFLLIPTLSFGVSSGIDDYWKVQRKGANIFSNQPRAERYLDAREAGIEVVRIAPNKWLNGRPSTELGDFLLGPKDKFDGVIDADLEYLIEVLDMAQSAGIKVVVTMVSLPGSRWSQHNVVDGKRTQQFDIWKDFKYHQQAAAFWKEIASSIQNHPALAGYNLINEPCPERGAASRLLDWYSMDYQRWYQGVKGTPADLNLFYREVIQAIRTVDSKTTIVLDAGYYANPYAFQILDPKVIDDANVLYCVHGYEPSPYAFGNAGDYAYPGDIPTGELDVDGTENANPPFAPVEKWNRGKFDEFYRVIDDWMRQHHIPSHQIWVSEFGVNRRCEGAVTFLQDSIDFFNSRGWHWAFYAYREDDGYHKMDYELGTGELHWKYWDASQHYPFDSSDIYPTDNPLWQVIQNALQ